MSAAHKAGLSLQCLQRSSHYHMTQRLTISHNAILSDMVQSPHVAKDILIRQDLQRVGKGQTSLRTRLNSLLYTPSKVGLSALIL